MKTMYVDMAYTGGGNDGSSSHPFTSIQAAFNEGFLTGGSDRNLIKIGNGIYGEALSLTTSANVEFYGDYDGYPTWNRGTGSGYTVIIQHPASGSPSQLFEINITTGQRDVYFERLTFQKANSKGGHGIYIDGNGVD